MDELLFSDLLATPKFFDAANSPHRVVEFYGDGTSTSNNGLSVDDFSVSESAFPRLWRQPWRTDAGNGGAPIVAHQKPLLLRVLICTPRVLDQDLWPLPMSPGSLTTLLSELGIPSLFPRAICHHIPVAASFECPSSGGDSWPTEPPSPTTTTMAATPSTPRYGIVLRTNLSHAWQYSVALVHDAVPGVTNAVVVGLNPPEVDELVESLRRLSPSDFACPATLPCILVDKCLDAAVRDLETRRRNLTQICQQLSTDGFHHANISDDQLQWERDVVDLDRAMKILTGMSDVCAGVEAVCLMQRDFVEVLEELVDNWDLGAAGVVMGRGKRVRETLKTFRRLLRGIESKVVYSKTSVQSQIQTIYGLISQRESKSQVELARISRRLADLARQDGAHMRVIAAVTLVFLPATFLATFFSTAFFDFRPDSSRHVSKWLWIYWIIAVFLVIGSFVLWWYAMRSTRQRSIKARRKRSELKEKTMRDEGFSMTTGLSTVASRPHPPRPYLSGSEVEVFQKKVALPTTTPTRSEFGQVPPPLAGRKSSIWWGRDRGNQIEEE